jgi:hypothetical protein
MSTDSRAQRAARLEMLALLADEIRKTDGLGKELACTLRTLPLLTGWLAIRQRGRWRALRVYCVSAGGAMAFLTGTGNLIGTADMAAAAREAAAAAAIPGARRGGR